MNSATRRILIDRCGGHRRSRHGGGDRPGVRGMRMGGGGGGFHGGGASTAASAAAAFMEAA